MMRLLLLAMSLWAGDEEAYHALTLAQAQTTSWTHVCVSGPVVYARTQGDGDRHITLDDGTHKVVLEIVPQHPLPTPVTGQRISACGIYRWDKRHNWPEVHPVWEWKPVDRMAR